MARVKRTLGARNEVPTASMADIAFLLLIFFLATTIFKMEEGLPVQLPRAEAGQRVQRQRITHIWVQSARVMTIDDNLITLADIAPILRSKLADDPALSTGLNIDQGALEHRRRGDRDAERRQRPQRVVHHGTREQALSAPPGRGQAAPGAAQIGS
jgi:biopolymer transport protein ExbD